MSVLCVGNVPEIFRERLALSFSVQHAQELPQEIGDETGYVVYAESATETADLTVLDSVDKPIGVCYWAPVIDHDKLLSVVLGFDVDAVLHGCPPAPLAMEYVTKRIRRYLDQLAKNTSTHDALALRSLFQIPAGNGSEPLHVRYHRSAGLTLLSASTQDMARRMRYTIRAMNREPVPEMPWTHSGRSALDEHGLLTPARPTLADLFQVGPPGDTNNRLGFGLAEQRRQVYPKVGMALIRGESGTGKSLIADLMRQAFQRSDQWQKANASTPMPFVRINCGAMTSENFDHTMFGTARDQFSGIPKAVVGLLPRADYGVAFFDEIGDMDHSAQSRLKAVLDDLVITPFGMEPYYLHLRVIAATNVALESSGFQHDLLQRFTYTITVPPLAERREELPRLIDFAAQNPMINSTGGEELAVTHISHGAVSLLEEQDWSHGNFRELRRVVESAVFRAISERRKIVTNDDVARSFLAKPTPPQERRVVRLATELDDPHEIPVRQFDDLDKASAVHQVPILESPDGDRWVRAAGVTYSYRSRDV